MFQKLKSFPKTFFKSHQNKSFSSMYSLHNSYTSEHGQGGTLQMSLENRMYDLKLETIWEDYTEMETWKKPSQQDLFLVSKTEGLLNNIFFISDENYKKIPDEIPEKYQIKVKLPEYYSYKIRVNGSIEHMKGYIDAKTYGNVDINILSNDGEILLNKLKSETCKLQNTDGKIQISSSLEVQNADIISENGEISIKKLGLTQKGYIFNVKGNISIGSVYGLVTKDKIQENLEIGDIGTEIHKTNFLSINSIHSNVKIGNVQGNLIVQCVNGNIDIKLCDSNQIFLENEKGSINLNLINLRENSLIKMNEKGDFTLNVSSHYKGNIYLIDYKSFWRGEKKNKEVPTLFIKGKISDKNISLNTKNDVYNFLKK